MDKRIAFALVFLMLPQSAGAQRFGATAGINFDRLSDITVNEVEARFSSQTGYHIGLWVEFPLGPLGLQIGARYLDAGQLFEGLKDADTDVQEDFDIDLVEFPVLVRYALGTPILSPYVFAGPVIRIATGIDHVLANDLKVPSYATEFGAGIELSLGRMSISPEVAYTFGVTSFIDDELILGGITLTPDDGQSLNSAMLRLSIGF